MLLSQNLPVRVRYTCTQRSPSHRLLAKAPPSFPSSLFPPSLASVVLHPLGTFMRFRGARESEVGLEIEEPFDWGHDLYESAFCRPVTTMVEVPPYLRILHPRLIRRVYVT